MTISISIDPISIMYITGILNSCPKNSKVQSNPFSSSLINSFGRFNLLISLNIPPRKWFLIKLVAYVPGSSDITFCSRELNDEIGMYAPHKKPYQALTSDPTAEICPYNNIIIRTILIILIKNDIYYIGIRMWF